MLATDRVRLDEVPTAMFAKARLEGVVWRCDCDPVPVRFATRGRLVSEVEMLTAPVRTPVCAGLKTTSMVQLAEEASCVPAEGQSPVRV